MNAFEVFHMPNLLNFKRCSYIKFGKNEISHVLSDPKKNYYPKSVFLQLMHPDRKFTYHIAFLPSYKRWFKWAINNSRPYVIHLNLENSATNIDILESYYFARYLDHTLSKTFDKESLHYEVEKAIKEVEWHFENEFDTRRFTTGLKSQGWSLDYIYME